MNRSPRADGPRERRPSRPGMVRNTAAARGTSRGHRTAPTSRSWTSSEGSGCSADRRGERNRVDLCTEAVCGDGLGHPIWSPDGRSVAVSNVLRVRTTGMAPISGSVWLARSDGSSVQRLTPETRVRVRPYRRTRVARSTSRCSSPPTRRKWPSPATTSAVDDNQPRPSSSRSPRAIPARVPCEPDYPPQVIGPRWSPAGGWIASVAGPGEMCGDRRCDRLGLTVATDVCTYPTCDGLGAPVWSPDGFMARRRRRLVDPAPRDPGRRSPTWPRSTVHTESYEPIAWLPPSDLLTVP